MIVKALNQTLQILLAETWSDKLHQGAFHDLVIKVCLEKSGQKLTEDYSVTLL